MNAPRVADVGAVGDPLHVLLVEDDDRLAGLLSEFLVLQGNAVTIARDGHEGLELALAHRFDVVLLDLMLPGRSGLEVCARLRESSDVPVLIVSASDAEQARIRGLESGADDYVCKPFSAPELLARMRAMVRRHRGLLVRRATPMSVGTLEIDPHTLSAKLGSAKLDLTVIEFELLLAFARNEGNVLARERILELVHGTSSTAFDRSIDGHISRLRRKLGDDPRSPAIIRTVRGAGYVFIAPKRGGP